jgi:hypothetical protein
VIRDNRCDYSSDWPRLWWAKFINGLKNLRQKARANSVAENLDDNDDDDDDGDDNYASIRKG